MTSKLLKGQLYPEVISYFFIQFTKSRNSQNKIFCLKKLIIPCTCIQSKKSTPQTSMWLDDKMIMIILWNGGGNCSEMAEKMVVDNNVHSKQKHHQGVTNNENINQLY